MTQSHAATDLPAPRAAELPRGMTSEDVALPARELLPFETTEDLEPLDSVIEQSRAMGSLELGLSVQRRNYHVFIAGPSGTGRRTLAHRVLDKLAPQRPTPRDVVYLHNFEDRDAPIAILLQAGRGKRLKNDLDALLDHLRSSLPAAFQAPAHHTRLQQIIARSNARGSEAFSKLRSGAAELGFEIGTDEDGDLVARPVVDGEALSDEQVMALGDESRAQIDAAREQLDPLLADFVHATRELEHETREKILDAQRNLVKSIVEPEVRKLSRRVYSRESDELRAFFKQLRDDILDNAGAFLPDDDDQKGQQDPRAPDPFVAFRANVVVDHSESDGAPVVFETQPSFYRVFGKIERRVEQGIYLTDHTMIRAGALARANGGFLICHAEDVLQFPGVWEGLKLNLRNKEVQIVDLGETAGLLPTSGLKPAPIPLDVKLVLIGSNHIYHLLFGADDDFRKLFQVKADFDHEIARTPETVEQYARFLAGSAKHNDCRGLTRDAVARVLRHSSRMAEARDRLSLRANMLGNLLVEANYHAARAGRSHINGEDVDTAIVERVHRSSLIADKMHNDLHDGTVLLESDGARVGVINGLAVLSVGEHAFGRPYRITARTFAGEAGVVNIEREVEMSGGLHDKGVQILSGFLGDHFAKDAPLKLTATVAFEQSYAMVDGDSASSTWLFAILSSLANLPLRQGIAVTGSVNQLGDIQVIGGVNEKVEGFFRFCARRGLDGSQGVIIPAGNTRHFIPSEEVERAIDMGLFHVWPIERIEQGIERLTGIVAGERGEDGRYPLDTVFGRAQARIDALRKAGSDDDSKADKG